MATREALVALNRELGLVSGTALYQAAARQNRQNNVDFNARQLRTLALGFVWGKAAGLTLSVSAGNGPQRRPLARLAECGCWAGGIRGVEGQGRAAAREEIVTRNIAFSL